MTILLPYATPAIGSVIEVEPGGRRLEDGRNNLPRRPLRHGPRDNAKRPATVKHGTNVIAGTKTDSIRNAILQQTSSLRRAVGVPEKWDGRAGFRILETLALEMRERSFVSEFTW